jgi:putative DNA primase/helicase
MTNDIFEHAKGRWRDLLIHCGIDERLLDGRHHDDCPICGRGTKRFRFDDRTGNGDWFCNQCRAGNGFSLLRKAFKWSDCEIFQRMEALIGECSFSPRYQHTQSDEKLRAYLNKIYMESSPLRPGNPAWTYLENRIHGKLPFTHLGDLRYHPALLCEEINAPLPAMLAPMGWDGKKYSGMHQTWITLDGQKAKLEEPKKMRGPAGAICVCRGDYMHLVGEGIETVIAANVRRFFDASTLWAAGNAGQLERFEWPDGCRGLVIAGDNDVSYTGQAAAYNLAHRLALEGHANQILVAIPPNSGTDWCDP